MNGSPFPFLVGYPGSGANVLAAMIDAHPKVAVTGGSDFAVALARRSAGYLGDPFDVVAFVRDVTAHRGFSSWGIDARSLNEAVATAHPSGYADAVRSVYAVYARGRGKVRCADRTDAYLGELPALAALFPEARFVHVVRDGRDVALAQYGGTRRRPSVEAVAVQWLHQAAACVAAGRDLGESRYLEVRYERLVASPAHALRSICDFLKIDFDPAMVRVAMPGMTTVGAWQRDMSERDRVRFEMIAGDLLDLLGYKRAQTATRMRTRMHVGVRRRTLEAGAALRSVATRGRAT